MHILILNWRDPKNPLSGGAELVTLAHAKAWVKHGHRVTWFTSNFTGAKRREVIDGVEIVRYGTYYFVHLLAPFFYFFGKRSFDVVIDEIHGIPFFTPLYVRKPKIAFIHEVAGKIWDSMYPFPINLAGKLSEKIMFIVYRNTQFWTDSGSTAAELMQGGIKPDKCKVIPCPISNAPVRTLPTKDPGPVILCVNRLVKMKGIEDTLDAFALVLKNKPTARLWIIGFGELKYLADLKKKAREKHIDKQLTWWGRVDEKTKLDFMRRAKILFHTSVKEGWGLVVLEAASQGTPSVVYNVPGLRDTVKNDKTGFIADKNTPQSLAASALKLLEDENKYKKLQTEGLSWCISFQWESVKEQSLELLRRVSGNSN